jgi:hypothetical protein
MITRFVAARSHFARVFPIESKLASDKTDE